MFKTLYYVTLLFNVILVAITPTDCLDKTEYGPYEVQIKEVEACQGPKKKECSQVQLDYDRLKDKIMLKINITKGFSLSNARIEMYDLTKNNSRVMVYNVNNPCQHFLMGPLIINNMKTNRTCGIIKGYYAPVFVLSGLSRMFLGRQFFYGQYGYKTYITDKLCNFLCLYTTILVLKKI